jgi:hypothetical protein
MILRSLNGAIRKVGGPVKLELVTAAGVITVGLQKSYLLDALKALHDDPTAETYLVIDGDTLKHTDEGAREIARGIHRQVVAEESDETIDIEDILVQADCSDNLIRACARDASLIDVIVPRIPAQTGHEVTHSAPVEDDLDDLLG